jgi:hypothetical protein
VAAALPAFTYALFQNELIDSTDKRHNSCPKVAGFHQRFIPIYSVEELPPSGSKMMLFQRAFSISKIIKIPAHKSPAWCGGF